MKKSDSHKRRDSHFYHFIPMKHRGMSMLEVLVAAVILALVLSGLGATFVISKKHSMHSVGRMTAVNLARFYLDGLAPEVRNDTWGSSCLGSGACTPHSDIFDSNFLNTSYFNYTTTYTINPHPDALSTIKIASVTINWTEVAPN